MPDKNKKRLIGTLLFATALLLSFGVGYVIWNAHNHLVKDVSVYSGVDPRFKSLKEKGWVPEAVPATFSNMRLVYSIDNSETFIQFNLAGSLDEVTSSNCVRTAFQEKAAANIEPYWRVSGWPTRLIKTNITSGAWPLYDCKFPERQHFWLTASPERRVYMWRMPATY